MVERMKGVYRTTKCFGVNGKGYPGSFPKGFLKWIREMKWWGDKRCYLCAGKVDDSDAVRVDIRPDCNPTHLEDARATSLPDDEFDVVIIDPPYTKPLAKEMYDTENYYSGINVFTKEALRVCKPGGLIITLSYEIPKRIKGCDFLAVCGIYTVPFCGYMRCLAVSRKQESLKSFV